MDYETAGFMMGVGDQIRRQAREAQRVVDHVAGQRDNAIATAQGLALQNEQLSASMSELVGDLKDMAAQSGKAISARDEEIARLRAVAMQGVEWLKALELRAAQLEEQLKAAKAVSRRRYGSFILEGCESRGLAAQVELLKDEVIVDGDLERRLEEAYAAAHEGYAASKGMSDAVAYRHRGLTDDVTGLRLQISEARERGLLPRGITP